MPEQIIAVDHHRYVAAGRVIVEHDGPCTEENCGAKIEAFLCELEEARRETQ